jgi:subtilase family serine protease
MYDDGGNFQPKVLVARTYRTSILTQTPILFYTLENFLAFTGNSSMSNNSKSETRKMILGSFLLLFLLSVSPAALTSGAITQNNSSTVAVNSNLEASPAGLIYSLVPNVACGNVHELCPSMLRTAYSMNTMLSNGINGTGQAVVIDDACGDPNIKSDLSTFDSQWGLPNPKLNIYTPQGTPCSDSGWSLETSLDVEWAHVVAPGATINLIEAAQPSFSDLYGGWSYALTHSLGNEISNSWGGGGNCGADSILSTAQKDNVTVLASAGDSGAWGQNHGGNVQPADCLKLLTVGGTTLNVMSNGSYVSESAWSGSGGGYVIGAKEPKFEIKANITDSFKELAKSDVSADADPNTGVLVYNAGDGGWFVVGGTSVSCPLWAGFLADVNQVRASKGLFPVGFVNPFLYTKVYGPNGSSSLYSKDFHDITSGNDGWPAGKGWDAPTGIGSFIATPLAQTLGTNSKA